MAESLKDDERAMEFEALMAIYEQELKIDFREDEQNSMNYRIDLKDIDAVLILQLSDQYPEIPPDIKVFKSFNHLVELEELLRKLSEDMHGEIMIYSLIEEAKKWAVESDQYFKDQQRAISVTQDSAASVCKFHLEGKCRFGDKCVNIHQSLNKENTSNQSHSCQKKGIYTDATSSPGDKETAPSKKSSMKTANDVISRILWDDKIDPNDFCIGYLDRFVGIIERPFADFSWDDIASVDYTVLSIPRHRIQYFKYLGHIVWDKRDRLDNVFGSTGSGLTIHEVVNSKLEERRDHEIPPTGEPEELDSFPSSIESETFSARHESTSNKNSNVPNYFLAFKVQDVELLEKIDELQKELVSREQGMNVGTIASQHLHITLLMLTIRNDGELTLVKDILKGIQHTLPSIIPPTHKLTYRGVGSFKERILYVSLDNEPRLKKWVQILTWKLRKAGICLDGNRETFLPHLTAVRSSSSSKISPAATHKVFSSIELLYEGTVFGKQGISDVGLFSRFHSKDVNDFHLKVFHIDNSFFSVLPSLKDKVVKYLENYEDSEKIDEELREKVQALLKANSTVEADKALSLLTSNSLRAERQKQCGRLVVILRGIPGCGKTHLLENALEGRQQQGLTICSPKQLFYRAGNSTMDQADLNIAEAYCRNGFLEALISNVSTVAVDDCHSQCWQYSLYKEIAAVFGVSVKVLQISCSDRESILKCHEYTDASVDVLLNLVEEWEDDGNAISIEPWFSNPDLQAEEGASLKALLN